MKVAIWTEAVTDSDTSASTSLCGRGYNKSLYDPRVCKLSNGEYIYLLLYVNDMLIASKNRSPIDKLKVQLSCELEMKDLGEVRRILGMKIERDRMNGRVLNNRREYFIVIYTLPLSIALGY